VEAAERSRWLAELAEAVVQAQRLARIMGVSDGKCGQANELYRRLEWVRIEVEGLRRASSKTHSTEIDPKWMDLVPWNRRQAY